MKESIREDNVSGSIKDKLVWWCLQFRPLRGWRWKGIWRSNRWQQR